MKKFEDWRKDKEIISEMDVDPVTFMGAAGAGVAGVNMARNWWNSRRPASVKVAKIKDAIANLQTSYDPSKQAIFASIYELLDKLN